MNADKLKNLQAAVRIGGPGSVRRKKKVIHKNSLSNEKNLQQLAKRFAVNSIPGIEEVNFFKDDGKIIHFANPKLQASIQANTYIVSGAGQEKELQELLPGIINQIAPDNLAGFKKILESLKGEKGAVGDEEVPELVENFDAPQAAEPQKASETSAVPEETPAAELEKAPEAPAATEQPPAEQQ
eukprot:TRINITY_DN8467_c0_g1_i1.p1 TRINITY_DN8467_c0_g1~~TRINITY_DN8467_c0_g1_i1.p1  ORF type:complete len:184 (+),score=51.03 TRINITY_DN8467_c0_g1_i1:72-623(+)